MAMHFSRLLGLEALLELAAVDLDVRLRLAQLAQPALLLNVDLHVLVIVVHPRLLGRRPALLALLALVRLLRLLLRLEDLRCQRRLLCGFRATDPVSTRSYSPSYTHNEREDTYRPWVACVPARACPSVDRFR